MELKSDPSASGPTKKWKYEDEMSFLLPYFKEMRTLNLYRTESQNTYVTEQIDVAEDYLSPEENKARSPSPDDLKTVFNKYTPARKRKKSCKAAVTANTIYEEEPSGNVSKSLMDNTAKSNDIQKFFDSIATTVQSFPPLDRAVAKAKVFGIISKMELEILSRDLNNYSDVSSPTCFEIE